MKRPVALLLLPLALAACGSQGGNNGAGAEKAAGIQAAASPAPAAPGADAPGVLPTAPGARLQPGQWELTAVVRSIEAPGAPPREQAALRQRLGRPIVNRTCMTEAQARDFASFANREAPRHGCAVGDRVYGNGIVRLSLSCPVPGGRPGTMRMTTQGRYTPTSLDLAISQQVPGPGNAMMSMAATISGRRIGACPPPGAGAPPPRIRPPSNAVPVVVAPPAR